MRKNCKAKEIREILLESNASAPWQEAFGRPISNMSDRQIIELFEPWNRFYTARKKMAFISSFAKRQTSVTPGLVVDFGCGTGSLCRFLSESGIHDITGCDISSSAIMCARAIAKAKHMSVNFIAGNIMKGPNPFQEGSLSVAILDSVLEHVLEYREMLKRLSSMLKVDGVCMVVVPSILGAHSLIHDFDYRHLQWKAQPYNYHPGLHCNHFWFSQLKREFANAGMRYEQSFRMQAFNSAVVLILQHIKLWNVIKWYTVIDYYISKLLPNNIATRIAIFKKC